MISFAINFFFIIEVFVVCLSCLCISFVCYNFKVTDLTLYMYLFIMDDIVACHLFIHRYASKNYTCDTFI